MVAELLPGLLAFGRGQVVPDREALHESQHPG
jgi:hypothetical protein